MKLIKMIAPNGKSEIECHPERKEYLIANGWTSGVGEIPKDGTFILEKGEKVLSPNESTNGKGDK